MTDQKYSRDDFSPSERIILLALLKSHEKGVGATDHLWIQKVSFLFRRLLESVDQAEGPQESGYIAYDFGPYSEEVEGSLNSLIKDGLLSVVNRRMSLTPKGRKIADLIVRERPNGAAAMNSILGLVQSLTPNELILYVYATVPEWAEASKIKGILRDSRARFLLAKKLLLSERLSTERAAEIAGLSLVEFRRRLTREMKS